MKSYPTVDAAYHEMTFSLGLALTQWQFVELKLFQLYAFLYGPSDGVGLNISFHEMGLDVRLRAIEALIKARTHKKELHKSWAHVKEDVYKQKRLRDKLAHWTVMTGPNQDGTYYAYLSPPSTDLKAEQMAADPVKAGAIGAPTLQEAAIKDFQFVSAAIHQYMIPRDLHEDARDHARSLIGTEPYERSRQERKKVEMLFAHLKRHLGFERLRLRGLSGARDEFLLAATVQNLRGLAKLVGRPPPTAVACAA